jgi:hemin uptake protein HemP
MRDRTLKGSLSTQGQAEMNKLETQDKKVVQISNHEATPIPTFDARNIVGKDGVGTISLDGTLYFLRITKANKLILTK